jgi:lipopolysaccharide export system protein LptA
VAKFREDVIFNTLNTATLYTNILDYDRLAQLATYTQGGKLVDSINVLTSRKGYYNANNNMASFKKDVHVKNPDYNMYSDSLQYNSRSKVIYFRTKTRVVNKDNDEFIYEGGNYDTKTRQSELHEGIAETPSYRLKGISYNLNDITQIYNLRQNVVMTAKEENLSIYGQAARYDKKTGIAKVFDHAYLAKVTQDKDTLFMSADTLVSIDSKDPAKKRLLAYHHVRIYKSDMQGLADSVVYQQSDSIFYLYHSPVLWSQQNQMTADTISMLVSHNTVKKIFMDMKAFVVSEDSLQHFNQIKGRNMIALLDSGAIHRVLVDGNGESIYYALDEKDHSLRGMNKIACSNITIRFVQGQINNVSFYVNADASFVPPHQITPDQTRLEGFQWLEAEKPTRESVLMGPPPSP